jgi:hypothetical protein
MLEKPAMSGRVFAAPWGTLLKSVSIGASLLLVGISLVIWFVPPSPHDWVCIPVSMLTLSLLLVCALYTVRGYRLEGRWLFIQRLLWNTRISLEGLRRASVDTEAMRKAFRLCGNGGLFAFTGWFRSKRIGTFRAFVTDPHRTVVLTFSERNIVLSPDRPQAFVDAISRNRHLGN